MTTRPFTLRAARPMVWMSEEAERRNPSLSASRMATRATSGKSRPSRSRLMPTRTSKTPRRRSRRSSTRAMVSMSECKYCTRTPCSARYSDRSSAIFLVRVVTSTRPPAATVASMRTRRSSIWPVVGRMSTSGSTSPVGRMTCSAMLVLCSNSNGPGVAESMMVWPVLATNSSKRNGRLSRAEGKRNPCSTSVSLRDRSPAYWPCSWGTATWLSSSTTRKSFGKKSSRVYGRLARSSSVEVPAVVLDAGAHARLGQHLEVELGAHAQALGLEQLAGAGQLGSRSRSSTSMESMAARRRSSPVV